MLSVTATVCPPFPAPRSTEEPFRSSGQMAPRYFAPRCQGHRWARCCQSDESGRCYSRVTVYLCMRRVLAYASAHTPTHE